MNTKMRLFMMRFKLSLKFICLGALLAAFGCDTAPTSTSSNNAPTAASNAAAANSNAPSNANMTTLAAAMPDAAFKEELALISPANMPSKMRAGDKQDVVVKVKNTSSEVWHARGQTSTMYQVFLSSQWEDATGKPVETEEHRAALPSDIQPNQTLEIKSYVTAPPNPGTYTLNIDMLQENVAWFRLKNSTPLKYKVTVEK